jgi:hypothetical protein
MTADRDRAFASIMTTMVETGVAPHHTELAARLGLTPDEGRKLMHETVAATFGWMHSGTDYIASFPPFNNQPTQYRISVDGRKAWFGQ